MLPEAERLLGLRTRSIDYSSSRAILLESTAKQCRDRLSSYIASWKGSQYGSAQQKKIMENKEIQDMVTALGCGIGTHFDIGAR